MTNNNSREPMSNSTHVNIQCFLKKIYSAHYLLGSIFREKCLWSLWKGPPANLRRNECLELRSCWVCRERNVFIHPLMTRCPGCGNEFKIPLDWQWQLPFWISPNVCHPAGLMCVSTLSAPPCAATLIRTMEVEVEAGWRLLTSLWHKPTWLALACVPCCWVKSW